MVLIPVVYLGYRFGGVGSGFSISTVWYGPPALTEGYGVDDSAFTDVWCLAFTSIICTVGRRWGMACMA